jgi:hypothetical protein
LSNVNLLSQILSNNAVTVARAAPAPVVASVVDVAALVSAIVEAALKVREYMTLSSMSIFSDDRLYSLQANVNVFAVLGNLNIFNSQVLSNLLNSNTITVARRALLDVAPLVKAVVSLLLKAAGYVSDRHVLYRPLA